MSIEQALLEVAAAMRELAAAYSSDAVQAPEGGTGVASPAAEGEKRGRGRPRKDAAAPAAPPPPPVAPAESPLGFAAPPAASAAPSNPLPPPPSTYTYEQIQRRLMEVDAQKGRQACVDLLSRYGATKLPEINPSQYTPFMSEMNAMLTTAHDPAAAAPPPPNLFG